MYPDNFISIWTQYPKRLGKKKAWQHFHRDIKSPEDLQRLQTALNNYLSYLKNNSTEHAYIQHGSTWFNNWEDWEEYIDPKTQDIQDKKESKAQALNYSQYLKEYQA